MEEIKKMDALNIICIAIWIWGAYKGWGIVSRCTWECAKWINRKEPLNYVVKGAVYILLGFGFVLIQLWKFVMKLMSFIF